MTAEPFSTASTLIIDAHAHMGYFRNFHIPHNDAAGMLVAMDEMGIDVVVVAHHAGISSDFRLGNDAVAHAMKQYPDRFLGYCVINPNYPDEVEGELRRCFSVPGFRGIKVHPELHGNYPLDGPNYRRMWEFADSLSIPVLSHSFFGGDGLDVFERLSEEYSRVPILLGHAGRDLGLTESIALVNRRPNIHLDLTGPLIEDGVIETLVAAVDVRQVVFGSDMPFVNAARQLGGLVWARVAAAEIERIAGHNAARIFRVQDGMAEAPAPLWSP